MARLPHGDPELAVRQGSPHARDYAAALAEVASAACELGEPTMRVIGNASVAAAAQLGAVPDRLPASAPTAADRADDRRRPLPAEHPAHRTPEPASSRRAGRAPSAASTSCWPSSTP